MLISNNSWLHLQVTVILISVIIWTHFPTAEPNTALNTTETTQCCQSLNMLKFSFTLIFQQMILPSWAAFPITMTKMLNAISPGLYMYNITDLEPKTSQMQIVQLWAPRNFTSARMGPGKAGPRNDQLVSIPCRKSPSQKSFTSAAFQSPSLSQSCGTNQVGLNLQLINGCANTRHE